MADGGIGGIVAVKIVALEPSGPGDMTAATHLSASAWRGEPPAPTQTRTAVALPAANPQTIERWGAAWSTIPSLCVVAKRKP